MDSVDKYFRKSSYNFLRLLLSMTGVWPFHSATKRYAVYFICFLILGSGLTFQVFGIREIWPNTLEVVDCLPVFLYGVIPILKVGCLVHTLPKIKVLLTKMKDHWIAPKFDEETKILRSHTIYGEKFVRIYSYIYLSHSVLYLSSTLLSKFLQSTEESDVQSEVSEMPNGIPYRTNYLVDPSTYYVPIFLHLSLFELYNLLLVVSQDVLYMTLVQHCCGLLAALRYLLANTFEFMDNTDDPTKTVANDNCYGNDKCFARFAYSIQRHSEAIQFVNIVESIYRLPLFLQMGHNVSILSIVGYQMIVYSNDINRLLEYALFFNSAILNAFLQNWLGQKIIDYSEKVYEYAYNVQWYDMPNAMKKFVILILLKSIKPCQLTAGKFIVMSYQSFSAVIRLSSSYLMLLRSVQ